jgi:hypothetical protein
MVLMLEDLARFGTASRFARHLQGMPIWELKTRSRGGSKGGARVYWFPLTLRFKTLEPETVAVMVNAEIKPGDTPNPRNLEEASLARTPAPHGPRALEVYFAFQDDPVGMLRRSS